MSPRDLDDLGAVGAVALGLAFLAVVDLVI